MKKILILSVIMSMVLLEDKNKAIAMPSLGFESNSLTNVKQLVASDITNKLDFREFADFFKNPYNTPIPMILNENPRRHSSSEKWAKEQISRRGLIELCKALAENRICSQIDAKIEIETKASLAMQAMKKFKRILYMYINSDKDNPTDIEKGFLESVQNRIAQGEEIETWESEAFSYWKASNTLKELAIESGIRNKLIKEESAETMSADDIVFSIANKTNGELSSTFFLSSAFELMLVKNDEKLADIFRDLYVPVIWGRSVAYRRATRLIQDDIMNNRCSKENQKAFNLIISEQLKQFADFWLEEIYPGQAKPNKLSDYQSIIAAFLLEDEELNLQKSLISCLLIVALDLSDTKNIKTFLSEYSEENFIEKIINFFSFFTADNAEYLKVFLN